MSFEIGKVCSGYEFLDVLRRTKYEIAYRVRNTLAQRLELLRVLPENVQDDREQVERFLREMRVHSLLVHPNIVAFYNAMELDGRVVMTTELVEGPTLADRLQRGPLRPSDAVDYISQALAALGYAHGHKVIHRDISADVIVFTPEGTVKLTQFGLAKAATSPQLTQGGAVLGNLKYISPEQVLGKGDLDPRSDLYSLGAVLYEALTGAPPFHSRSQFELMLAHVSEPPKPPSEVNPNLPAALDAVLLRALAKDPAARFQTADEFRESLQAIRGELEGVEAPAAHATPVEREETPEPATPALMVGPPSPLAGESLAAAPVEIEPAAATLPAAELSPEPMRAEPAPVEAALAPDTAIDAPMPAETVEVAAAAAVPVLPSVELALLAEPVEIAAAVPEPVALNGHSAAVAASEPAEAVAVLAAVEQDVAVAVLDEEPAVPVLPEPELLSEPEPELEPVAEVVAAGPGPEPEVVAEVVTAEPEPEPEGVAEVVAAEPELVPEAVAEAVAEKEPVVEAALPEPEPEPEPVAEVVTAEPEVAPEPVAEAVAEKGPVVEAALPEPEPEPEPVAEVVTAEPEVAPEPVAEVVAEKKPVVEAALPEPEPEPEPVVEVVTAEPEVEPEPVTEVATAEPELDPEAATEVVTLEAELGPETVAEPKPVAEAAAEPEPAGEAFAAGSEPAVEPATKPKQAAPPAAAQPDEAPAMFPFHQLVAAGLAALAVAIILLIVYLFGGK
ncbi:MAG: protein kinase domain-containing protein [Acidobacteriota bacterium]